MTSVALLSSAVLLDEDLDLYDDFIVSNLDQKSAAKVDLKKHNEDLERDNENLRLRISNLEQECEATKKINLALRRNISILYKTAKQEIEAKNSLIRDLQTRYDGLLFRRSKRDALPVCGHSISSFSNNAALSPHLTDMPTEENSKSNKLAFGESQAKSPKSGCHSPAFRSNGTPTHSRHHERSRVIHREGAADLNRGRNIPLSTPEAHIPHNKCENDASHILNVNTKNSKSPKSDKDAMDQPNVELLNVELNCNVLNSISIDSLKEIAKLCKDSRPQHSKRSLNYQHGSITDAERVLAHCKRKAVQVDARKRLVSRIREDNIDMCWDHTKKYEASKVPAISHRTQHSKHSENNHTAMNFGVVQQESGDFKDQRSKKKVGFPNPSEAKHAASLDIVTENVSKKDVCLPNLLETCDKISARIDDNNSCEEGLLESCQVEGSKGQVNDDATNNPINEVKHDQYTESLILNGCSFKTHVSEPSNEKTSVSKVNSNSSFKMSGDTRDRIHKKNDECYNDIMIKTTEKAKDGRSRTQSSSRPLLSNLTGDRSLSRCNEKYDCKNSHTRTTTDGHTRFSMHRDLTSRRESGIKLNVRSKEYEKHRKSRPDAEKPGLDNRDSRGNHKLSRSSLVQEHSTKYASMKGQRHGLDATNGHLEKFDCRPISHPSKSAHLASSGVYKDKHRTHTPRLRDSPQKRKLVELDSLHQRDSDRKKARLKHKHHSSAEKCSSPCYRNSTSKPGALLNVKSSGTGLEDGELPSEEYL